MSQFDSIAEELFKRGQLIRDNWFRAWVANIDRMRAEFENSERFLQDYQHLLQPTPPPPQPLRNTPYPPEPLGASQGMMHGIDDPIPPPVPESETLTEEDILAWEQRLAARRDHFSRG